jgi:UDP-GlcNAc:undecaprenyl-phosphate GlcNAc-1-phosphate transferase
LRGAAGISRPQLPPPARIFMGDSGSLFTGLLLAGLALSPAPGLSRTLFAVVVVPAVVLAVPILDTAFVTVTRLLEGRPISEGGRDHTSHGLVALGISEERVVWLVWGLAVAGGLIGLVIRSASRTVAYALGGGLLVLLALFGLYLLSSRMRALDASELEEQGQVTQVFNRLLRLHQRFPLLTVLMDVVFVAMAYYGAYLVRWDADRLPAELDYFTQTLALVIVVKLVALAAAGAYAPRLRHYGLGDLLGTVRGNLLGTLLTASVLLVVARVGLSRGVLVVDLLMLTALTVVGRPSFRLLDHSKERWSSDGTPVAFVGRIDDAELVLPAMRMFDSPRLRLVAVVDRMYGSTTGRFRGYPLFGGEAGIANAVRECGLHAVVVVDRGRSGEGDREFLSDYVSRNGALDVFAVRVSVGPASTYVSTDVGAEAESIARGSQA